MGDISEEDLSSAVDYITSLVSEADGVLLNNCAAVEARVLVNAIKAKPNDVGNASATLLDFMVSNPDYMPVAELRDSVGISGTYQFKVDGLFSSNLQYVPRCLVKIVENSLAAKKSGAIETIEKEDSIILHAKLRGLHVLALLTAGMMHIINPRQLPPVVLDPIELLDDFVQTMKTEVEFTEELKRDMVAYGVAFMYSSFRSTQLKRRLKDEALQEDIARQFESYASG